MRVTIFTGPTLPPKLAERELQATYLPPVSQGDVYRATVDRADVIGIIDGYFHSVPAVWHKEILWAISQGIRVYGSASMGALRAAELAPFGMTGVGWIYEAFRDGTLLDDDEVAVQHGPAETGFVCVSEAMVNIRRTLERAEEEGVVSESTRSVLESAAKALYYPKRSYARLLHEGRSLGVKVRELAALSDWLPSRQINQKRIDATLMLQKIRETKQTPLVNPAPNFVFEHTDMWDQAIDALSHRSEGSDRQS